MTNRAAVIIGVDKPGGQLPPLRAAAKGAKQFASWAKGQQYQVELLTDETGPVTASIVRAAVNKALAIQGLEHLLVYFSGHGLRVYTEGEQWLLTDSPENSNEAVNLLQSISSARCTRVPHITFISDACRSLPDEDMFQRVYGTNIFPNQNPTTPSPEVDVFYASLPAAAAYELRTSQVIQQGVTYNGVFTEEMLRCLNGGEDQVVVSSPGPPPLRVVAPRELKKHLITKVPALVTAVNLTKRQDPDIRIESSFPPHYLAHLPDDSSPRARARSTTGPTRGTPGTRRMAWKEAEAGSKPMEPRPTDLYRSKDLERLRRTDDGDRSIRVVAETQGRGHFETKTGFSVVGGRVLKAYSDRGKCDLFDERGEQHVRVNFKGDERKAGSLLLKLDDGNLMTLAVLYGYIGEITIDKDEVVNVNYTPSEGTPAYSEYQAARTQLDERRSVVAALARHSLFRVDREHAREQGNYIRSLKSIDPTLGLYAVYAYQAAGLFQEIRSVYEYMANEGSAIPFDVALLANKLEEGRGAPFCPMLSQGWAYLDPDHPIHRRLQEELRPHLLPGLWTTFKPAAERVLHDFLEHRF